MKNRGRPKNHKGNRRRFQSTPVPHSKAFDLSDIPAGFVVGRLGAEIEGLFQEVRQGRQLLRAVHDLAKRDGYGSLVADLEAVLTEHQKAAQPPPTPQPSAET